MDTMMTPAQHYLPSGVGPLGKSYIACPRMMYAHLTASSVSRFRRWTTSSSHFGIQGDAHPFAHVKDIYCRITEFRDLGANPRCLLESQVLALRMKMLTTSILSRGPAPASSSNAWSMRSGVQVPGALGPRFDPYDTTPMLTRILVTGANFPSVANLVCDVFAGLRAHHADRVRADRSAPQRAHRARRGVHRALDVGPRVGLQHRLQHVRPRRGDAAAVQRTGTGTAPERGASTPFSRGPNALLEEEEHELKARELERACGTGCSPSGARRVSGASTRGVQQGLTPSLSASSIASAASVATAFTMPDLGASGLGLLSLGLGANGSRMIGTNGSAAVGTPTTPMPLTPVAPLPTGDAEAQIGLAKVAEPDMDAFLTYGAIVPEYCHLETMLVKGIIQPPPLPPRAEPGLLLLIPSCANLCSDTTDSSSLHATVPHAPQTPTGSRASAARTAPTSRVRIRESRWPQRVPGCNLRQAATRAPCVREFASNAVIEQLRARATRTPVDATSRHWLHA
ncbi:hypothetical protein GGX14DRAFT_664683 [Mycena pura]|uniref:Uncharacterized protein n=1 Tax=Mycena pura TaxID=153505 RepID=A0AAD6V3S9_9AGAR|nr:hypothetical protein GGX14DRAFT_664683 [Mycena pura]